MVIELGSDGTSAAAAQGIHLGSTRSASLSYCDPAEGAPLLCLQVWLMGLQDLTQLNALDEAHKDGQQTTSFFHWFTEPVDGAEDEVAETIREQIWPNPLQLYMGETVRALYQPGARPSAAQLCLTSAVSPLDLASSRKIVCVWGCPMERI